MSERSPGWDPPHFITTARVVMRAYTPEDAPAVGAAIEANYLDLRRRLEWAWDEPEDRQARRARMARMAEAFDAREDFILGVFDRSTGAFLGGTGLHPRQGPGVLEIGYWLIPNARGMGLMTEAAGALTLVALAHQHAVRVEIRCDPLNEESARIPRRLGFILDATLPPADPPGRLGPRETQVWAATAAHIAREPLASVPRPTIADANGRPLPWPS